MIRRSSLPARPGEELKKIDPEPNYPPGSNAIPSHLLEVALPNPASVIAQNGLAALRAHQQFQSFADNLSLRLKARELRAFCTNSSSSSMLVRLIK